VDEQLESLGDPQLLLEALKRVLVRDGNSSASSRTTPAPENDGAASNGMASDAKAIADRATGTNRSKNSAV
jgi:hypothetical protein